MELGSGCKGSEDIEHGQIEVQGWMTGNPIRRVDVKVPGRPADEVSHIGVRDWDALGESGGSGGKENVCRVVGAIEIIQWLRRVAVAVLSGEIRREMSTGGDLLGTHPAEGGRSRGPGVRPEIVQQRGRRPRRQDASRLSGGDHMRESGSRARQVEGHVDAVGLQNSQDRHDGRGRFGHEETDPVSPHTADVFEKSRQLVGLRFQLLVRELFVVHDHSDGGRPSLRLFGDPLLEQMAHYVTCWRACAESTSVDEQHRQPAKASHYVLGTNSEVDETSDLVHTMFTQAFGLMSAVIESSDEAEWTANVLVHLTSDHDFSPSVAEPGKTPILSGSGVMMLLHLDVDLNVFGHGWPGDSFDRVVAFRNKGVSHQCDVTAAAMVHLYAVPINPGFAHEFLNVMPE